MDILESSIVPDAKSYTQKLKNSVFQHFVVNRDALGFPKGKNSYPFFVTSNDLCGILFNFLDMVQKTDEFEGKTEIFKDVPNMLHMLIESYDERCDAGCCGPWHSMPKEELVNLYNQMKTKIKDN
jgi:hypothetical protein